MLRIEQPSLGFFQNRQEQVPFRLSLEDRLQSVYVVGKTGTGKSTALLGMMLDDIREGHGLCLIDPHGDLYRDVLGRIPSHRHDDVVLLDPADAEFPVGLNPLEVQNESERHFIVQEFVGIVARLIEDEFGAHALAHMAGPIFFQHLRMGLLLATSDLEDPGTLLEFYNIFHTRTYWKKWLPLKTKDPLLEQWVANVLPRTNYVAPGSDHISLGGYIGSKLESFVFDPRFRNIFGQKRATVNVSDAMDSGKILLVNLARGELTEMNSRFMGMILLALLQNAAMRRGRQEGGKRRPFFLYVDEFQSMATQSFVSLLSECRKFGVGLVLANQFISQISNTRITDAILGNVGTLISFRVGPGDCDVIEQQISPGAGSLSLLNLPNFMAYVKALTNGDPSRSFAVQAMRPSRMVDPDVVATVRTLSRQRYGRPRAEVERIVAQSFRSTCEETQKEESVEQGSP